MSNENKITFVSGSAVKLVGKETIFFGRQGGKTKAMIDALTEECSRLREENRRLKEQLKEEGERGAREMAEITCSEYLMGRLSIEGAMDIWREGKK